MTVALQTRMQPAGTCTELAISVVPYFLAAQSYAALFASAFAKCFLSLVAALQLQRLSAG